MAQHLWTIFCRNAIVDTGNTVSLINVIEELGLHPFPSEKVMVPGSFNLISTWMRDERNKPEKGKLRFTICNADNENLAHTELDFDLTENIRFRANLELNSFPIDGPGVYNILVEILDESEDKWNLIHQVPVEILRGEKQ